MTKKSVLGALTTLSLATISVAWGQQAKTVPVIGVLRNDTPTLFASRNDALRQGLRELGYIEGENIRFEYRYADNNNDRLPQLARELVGLKVDVILTGSNSSTRVAKNATSTIPIVVGSAGDLVGGGIVASLAKPGGNVTGSTDISPDVSGKRLELLKEVLPQANRVAVLFWRGSGTDMDEVKETEIAAPHFGVKIQRVELADRSGFTAAYAVINKQRANAVIFIQGPIRCSIVKKSPNWRSSIGCRRCARR